MKKLLSIIIMVFTGLIVNAQAFVGGSFGANSSKTTYKSNSVDVDNKYFEISIAPKAGYFISANIAMGMGIGAAISKETANDGDVYTDIVATFSPFARYYINPANNLSLFFEGSLGLGIGTSEYDPDYGEATKDILSVVTIGLTPAVSYKISDNFSLEAAVGGLSYSTMNLTDNDDSDIKTTVSGFGLNFGLDNLTFGAIFKL